MDHPGPRLCGFWLAGPVLRGLFTEESETGLTPPGQPWTVVFGKH